MGYFKPWEIPWDLPWVPAAYTTRPVVVRDVTLGHVVSADRVKRTSFLEARFLGER